MQDMMEKKKGKRRAARKARKVKKGNQMQLGCSNIERN